MDEYFRALMQLNINRQAEHPLLPIGTHDERARQSFVKSFHQRASNLSRSDAARIYAGRVVPRFAKEHGKPPATAKEARQALEQDIHWQFMVGLRRTAQEQLWACVIDTVEHDVETLKEKAEKLDQGLGSLRVDPDLEIPNYLTAVDIHAMPGNYHTEHCEGDLSQGALYDRGTFLYTHGYIGPDVDNLGKGVVAYIKEKFPDFRPRRILDMGAAIGNSTLPFCDAFPEAEIYAIDLGAPLVRYGYARANAMGKAIHFSQQNAEHTDFDDGYFDLVVSHIMFHETSRKAIPNIFAESLRLLSPGGKMIHADLPNVAMIPDLFQQVSVNQDHYDNNEPMWASYHDMNMPKVMVEAGFDQDKVKMDAGSMIISVPPSSDNPDPGRTVVGRFGYGIMAAEV